MPTQLSHSATNNYFHLVLVVCKVNLIFGRIAKCYVVTKSKSGCVSEGLKVNIENDRNRLNACDRNHLFYINMLFVGN